MVRLSSESDKIKQRMSLEDAAPFSFRLESVQFLFGFLTDSFFL